MVFFPSSRIQELMRIEGTGVWIDRVSSVPSLWMVSKLPMNMIRAIHAGAPLSFHSWIVRIDRSLIPAFGLRIADDPVRPSFAFGCCRSDDEVQGLVSILGIESFSLQLHNEVFLPVLSAECRTTPELARPVLDLLNGGSVYVKGQGRAIRGRALDSIQASLEPGASFDDRLKASCELPLRFGTVQPLNVHVIGSGSFSLNDSNEGAELERLTFQAFEALCPFGAFHQPQIRKGGVLRELCDVLAASRFPEREQEGVFLVESKVAAVTPEALTRTTRRRAASIQKNLMRAISQLKGAVRGLRSGAPIFKADGATPIEVDPQLSLEPAMTIPPLEIAARAKQMGHAIAMVSDMHDDVDWKAIADELLAATQSSDFLFHVLDLRELQHLVSYSRERPAVFEGLLIMRWQRMRDTGSALIRSRFLAK